MHIIFHFFRLASTVRDYDLKEYVDRYIEEKFDEVEKTNEFLALPRVKVSSKRNAVLVWIISLVSIDLFLFM